ncbi:MAG TPA: class I SAM-dependent methyltransferase [Vicinamibacterales bacterium]|nr:class I SAM-dependent methyltransferase [Vicinamibacterales bacterium]
MPTRPGSDVKEAPLFDDFVDDYEEQCAEGLSLSGETRDYFARQRILHTKRLCSSVAGDSRSVTRLVDFGCGLGHSTPYLLEAFPQASIIGFDESDAAIRAARQRYSNERVEFASGSLQGRRPVDMVYSNGTFHHIEPAHRDDVVASIVSWLAPGGLFVLWENNPWNPGTRLVMNRIAFDRGARMLSSTSAVTMLRRSGLRVLRVSSHFYFPRWLRALRPAERWLERLRLGAQYCVVAQKP